MITAITFDFWSTLYQGQPIDYTARRKQLQENIEAGCGQRFSEEIFSAAIDLARTAWNDTWVNQHRTIGAGEWLSIILSKLETRLPETHFSVIEAGLEDRLLEQPPFLAPNIKDVLAELSQHYKLAVISDTGLSPGRVLRHILEKDGLARYFSYLTFSDELGHSKPHPQAFLHTLQQLNAYPQNAVHIGDLLRTDIAGAQNVGMRGVQYTGLNKDNLNGVNPDAVINNHLELAGLLEKWG